MAKLKHATIYAFLDTNIFLEFKDFSEISWPEILGYTEVVLVIAPIVFFELDEKKRDPTSERRRSVARRLVKKINAIIEAHPPGVAAVVPGRPHVSLLQMIVSPDMTQYPDLQATETDDRLIAAVLLFQTRNTAIPKENIVIIADDGGVRGKARFYGLQAQPLDDAWELPDEPTETEKALKEARRQLQKLESQLPRLRLGVLNDGNIEQRVAFAVTIIADLPAAKLQELYQTEVQATAWSPLPGTLPGTAGGLDSPLSKLWAVEIAQYGREREEYLNSYKAYLQARHRWEQIQMGHIWLQLDLLNNGTGPAQDIVIQLDFPERFQVYDVALIPRAPTAPDLPPHPLSSAAGTGLEKLSRMQIGHSNFGLFVPPALRGGPPDPDSTEPTVRRQGTGIRVEWQRNKVVQSRSISLPPLMIVVPPVVGDSHYKLAYRIIAANLPDPVPGLITLTIGGREGTTELR